MVFAQQQQVDGEQQRQKVHEQQQEGVLVPSAAVFCTEPPYVQGTCQTCGCRVMLADYSSNTA
jgi:hypothetical protein